MARHTVSSFVFMMLLAAMTAGAQQDFGPNWLFNPGAEIQPVNDAGGWHQVSGDWSRTGGNVLPHSGQSIFYAGVSDRAELAQDIPVTGLAGWLADGSKRAVLRTWLNSSSRDADTSQVLMDVLSADGTILMTGTTGAKNVDKWTLDTLSVQLPPTTALIRVRLVATRVATSDNDGYFDDVSLYLVDPDGIPPVLGASAAAAPGGTPAVQPPVVQATPPAPAVLQDRSGPVTKIQTSYGFYKQSGELLTTAGIKNRTYIDTYQYTAEKGESMSFIVSPGDGQGTDPRLSVTGPGGQSLPVTRRGNASVVQTAAPAAGSYTILVSAADPARLGTYNLIVTGKGKETRGKLDPFAADRDGMFFFNAVDFVAENPGMYRIQLWEGYHDPELILRDANYKDVARDDGSGSRDKAAGANLGFTANVGTGTYHVIIEDDFTGGDWRLLITYLGPSGK